MARMKKEKAENLKKERKRKLKVVHLAPVIIGGQKYNYGDVIDNIDENYAHSLIKQGLCEWVEN